MAAPVDIAVEHHGGGHLTGSAVPTGESLQELGVSSFLRTNNKAGGTRDVRDVVQTSNKTGGIGALVTFGIRVEQPGDRGQKPVIRGGSDGEKQGSKERGPLVSRKHVVTEVCGDASEGGKEVGFLPHC